MTRRRLLFLIVPMLLAIVVGSLAGIGVASVIHMPKVEALEDYTPNLITQLFDRHGRVFATYAREKRILLEEGDLPEVLQNAVIAAEDSNFFQHGGVDAQGVLRAVYKNLGRGRKAMGGSTITMQLARQLYLTPRKTWRRKVEEALLAVELEKTFSKQQILTLYCNLVFLGHGNYGMEAAARSFFDKTVSELEIHEAAMLAGIPQRPSSYSPYKRPDLVLERRNYVLRRMREENLITEQELLEGVSRPLDVVPTTERELLGPYFSEEVRRYLQEEYGREELLQNGLQVYTTLDPDLQRATEQALRWGLARLDHRWGWRGPLYRVEDSDLEAYELPAWSKQKRIPGKWLEGLVLESGNRTARVRIGDEEFTLDADGIDWTRKERPRDLLRVGDVAWFRLEDPEEEDGELRIVLEQEPEIEGAALVIESATGAIRAMVGGWDFRRSSFNRATQARRQVGSAIKPFVFGAALEAGFTPADTIFDAPAVFEGAEGIPDYSPRNFYRRYSGITTLRKALEKSMNVSSAKLMNIIGADRVVDFSHRCGISTYLPPWASLALGAIELTPLELAGAYASIANQGQFVAPYLIDRITAPDGRVLEENSTNSHPAMEPEVAYVLGHMLEGVIDRGTGVSASRIDTALAGKTGTTDNYIDAWFAGFTTRYTVLTWVGYDVNRSLGRNMTGAEAALPIWKRIVERGIEEGWIERGSSFPTPPGVTMARVEYNTGFLPGPGATQTVLEAFVAGTEPVRQYDPEWARVLKLPWYQQRPFYLPKAGERMPEDTEDWTTVQEAWDLKENPDGEKGGDDEG